MVTKQETGTKTGACGVCGINCWEDNKPMVWPCGVKGCPYETPEQQAKIGDNYEVSDIGNSLQLPFYEGG